MSGVGKVAGQSSVAYGGYATADDSSVITDRLDVAAQKIQQIMLQEPEAYVSIFDRIWLFGLNGDDTVRLLGLAVLVLSGISAYKNVFKKKEA